MFVIVGESCFFNGLWNKVLYDICVMLIKLKLVYSKNYKNVLVELI